MNADLNGLPLMGNIPAQAGRMKIERAHVYWALRRIADRIVPQLIT
jgi:hypothetical protein